MTVTRDISAAANETFDLIVVGGGVYGAMLLLEASRCGLRAVAVERDDFGGGTSWNHLRILHGGLRYLRSLDWVRHRESVEERRRFLIDFEDYVHPLPCWMPLTWKGPRNPIAMGVAGQIDAWISTGRNAGVASERQLPRGGVWKRQECIRHVDGWGIGKAANAFRWFDAFVPRPRRLLMEILHRACDAGSLALNYTEALSPIVRRNAVAGLLVRDRLANREIELRAPLVVNAAGPETGNLTQTWGCGSEPVAPHTLSWNVLLDIAPDFDEALAVAAPRRGAPVLFLIPWEGRLLAGTGHAAAQTGDGHVVPLDAFSAFLEDLKLAVPGLGVHPDRVLRVYSGLLPAVRARSKMLSVRPAVIDHGAHGEPKGLWSVVGVKFTTARRVAAETLRRATGRLAGVSNPAHEDSSTLRRERLGFGPDWRPESDPDGARILQSLIGDESVIHLDDLLLRRTSLGDDPRTANALAPTLAQWFGEDEATRSKEFDRVKRALGHARSPLE
jgi:glycerol-3-phosphate dehydrogenase